MEEMKIFRSFQEFYKYLRGNIPEEEPKKAKKKKEKKKDAVSTD